jgi:hypothetical protein
MKVLATLNEILDHCNDWIHFCDKKGFDEYAVNYGGGDVEVELTIDEAFDFGLLKGD